MKCEVTGKTRFEHKVDARTFINTRKDVKLREYPCPDCGGWHVTKLIHDKEKVPRDMLNLPIQHTNDFKKYIDGTNN